MRDYVVSNLPKLFKKLKIILIKLVAPLLKILIGINIVGHM